MAPDVSRQNDFAACYQRQKFAVQPARTIPLRYSAVPGNFGEVPDKGTVHWFFGRAFGFIFPLFRHSFAFVKSRSMRLLISCSDMQKFVLSSLKCLVDRVPRICEFANHARQEVGRNIYFI